MIAEQDAQDLAQNMQTLFRAYISKGFTREEAFELLRIALGSQQKKDWI